MKTQYYTATSLDGFIATDGHSVEWLDRLGHPEASSFPDFIANVGAIAMGAGTYEWILRYLHSPVPEGGEAPQWPYSQRTWVFTTRTLPPVPGAQLEFVQGDVRRAHAAMRAVAGERNIWVAGGGNLAAQFFDAGLLDELIVQVGSITLGSGRPLFPRQLTTPLVLESVRQMSAAFAELRYRVER